MDTNVNIKIKKLLFDKGYDHPLSKDKYIHKHSLAGANFNRGDVSYVNITILDSIMWIYKKHNFWIYVHKDGGWWFPVIENYYDEDDQGTIIEDLSKMKQTLFNTPIQAYNAAINYCLKNLI
jgi:hypothetical protein